MIDILFTHSYFLKFDPKEEKAMMPYPPLGTLYAASSAREQGYSVALFDSMLADGPGGILESIRKYHPRIVVIYDDDFNYLTKMCLTRMREASFSMASLAKDNGCTIIVHGSDAADHLAEYLAHGADAVIFGEGERTLIELLAHYLRGLGRKEEIDGIAYLDRETLRKNRERSVVKDLDEFSFPARDLIDTEMYRRVWVERHGYFSTNIVTTRGCPFHCNWCAKPVYGQVYNSRSPENVVQEMKLVKENIKPDHLWFCDDIFGLKPGWIEEFSKEVVKQDAVIPFKCLARVDLLLKGRTIPSLREAGCKTVWVGAESGSQKILDAMDKGTTVEQIYEASQKLKEVGIRVGFFLQYGYPGETLEDIELTLRMVRECDPDEIGVSVSYPLPGTKFYDRVRQEMIGKQNWIDSQDLAMMFSGTYAPDFYRTLHHVTHKRFRIWKGVSSLKRALRNPLKTGPGTLRSLAAGFYHFVTLPAHKQRLATLARVEHPAHS